MNQKIEKSSSPEEKEINKYKERYEELNQLLAEKELILETLKSENRVFEIKYMRVVGIKYAELDEIEAKIAELLTRSQPDNVDYMHNAEELRNKANESASEAGQVLEQKDINIIFEPTESIKKLYRDIARQVHPDLGNDADRDKRQKIMAEVNKAYEAGDEERLVEILNEWRMSEDTVDGSGIAFDLVRIIRKIDQVESRIKQIDEEIEIIKSSDIYKLRMEVELAAEQGRDMLAEMAEKIQQDINEANKRLDSINLQK